MHTKNLLYALLLAGTLIAFRPPATQAAYEVNFLHLKSEPAVIIRQSQNTFIQWVLSLLPNRPSILGGPSITTTTVAPDVLVSTTELPPQPQPATATPAAVTTTTAEPTTLATASTTTTTTAVPSTTPAPPPIILNPPRNCTECVCGIANTQKRIVGGQETETHQYPWMAMLLYGGRFYCAASLINDQFLITASHCVYGFRKERISVRLLEHDRKMSNFLKIDRNVVNITTHPKYNARTYDNDIAIIQLDKPVELTELLHPVCMPTPGKSFKGETAIVTGWGAIKVGGPTADTLQEVQVPIMSQEDCRKSRYGPTRITDNMLCAGFDEGKKDSCQGDSGGPLHVVAPGTREHQIAGVVSWGEGCAKAGFPGVYARVNRYGSWIKMVTRNACLCHSETKKIKKL
ncbi:PREDICTED: trypsin-1-like [Rhagoletis zephyria]|uniref:trypsin-1-like n=1 Tax=Rhagoletis zephyria TaxID=28612 RepID=UPI0008112BEA|nr:PREDICTED: trypsin-1-like [Rhagoletis zephyria]